MSPANDRTGVGGGTAEYETPDSIYGQMHRRWIFDYDAFASHENTKCATYSTLDGTFRNDFLGLPAEQQLAPIQISSLDGLGFEWTNRRVFCNPPYTRGAIQRAVSKMAHEVLNGEPQLVVALIPAATDTEWFHDFVMPNAHIIFLPRRIQFIHPPFECGPKCQVPNKDGKVHQLGKPNPNPPGAYCIAEFKTKWSL